MHLWLQHRQNVDLFEPLRLTLSLWRERDILSRSTFKNQDPSIINALDNTWS
jgi:hypothetical protein